MPDFVAVKIIMKRYITDIPYIVCQYSISLVWKTDGQTRYKILNDLHLDLSTHVALMTFEQLIYCYLYNIYY